MNGDRIRVLVVDDEESIRDLLTIGLQHRGYEVVPCPDAEAALEAASRTPPEVAILDIMLPGMDGLDLCRQLRERAPDLFILMLTARDAVSDRIQGLELGADDYLVKPFDFDELVARIRAGIRRLKREERAVLRFGDLVLDDTAHRVTRGERTIALTAKEFELLRYLMRHPGRVLSKSQIIAEVWGYQYPGDENLVEVHMYSLREKLGDREKTIIQTVRGFGYRLGD
ncbi:MAG: response regulator transcription factor [Firmicutes bacterium]|nr:response regulator transcription factor [Alicyclobacillaceae bacterium]MCL6496592.1 response regulator transcription factor [Bacillota bacterium]